MHINRHRCSAVVLVLILMKLCLDMPTQHNSPIYKNDAPQLDAGELKITPLYLSK